MQLAKLWSGFTREEGDNTVVHCNVQEYAEWLILKNKLVLYMTKFSNRESFLSHVVQHCHLEHDGTRNDHHASTSLLIWEGKRIRCNTARLQGVFLADMRAAIWLQHSTSTLALSHDCKNITEPIKTAFHIYKLFCCSLGRQLLVTMIFRTAMTGKVHWEWSEANFVINKNCVWHMVMY